MGSIGKYQDLRCSFCGKRHDEVVKLIAGPKVYICDQCVRLCVSIVDQASPSTKTQEAGKEPEIDPGTQTSSETVPGQTDELETLITKASTHLQKIIEEAVTSGYRRGLQAETGLSQRKAANILAQAEKEALGIRSRAIQAYDQAFSSKLPQSLNIIIIDRDQDSAMDVARTLGLENQNVRQVAPDATMIEREVNSCPAATIVNMQSMEGEHNRLIDTIDIIKKHTLDWYAWSCLAKESDGGGGF